MYTRQVFSEVHFAPDVWKMDLATSSLDRITTEDSSEDYPHVTADGQRLVFQSDRGETQQIWSLDLRDGTLLQVPTAGESSFPRWSPDGAMLAYSDHSTDGLVVQRWGQAGGANHRHRAGYGHNGPAVVPRRKAAGSLRK